MFIRSKSTSKSWSWVKMRNFKIVNGMVSKWRSLGWSDRDVTRKQAHFYVSAKEEMWAWEIAFHLRKYFSFSAKTRFNVFFFFCLRVPDWPPRLSLAGSVRRSVVKIEIEWKRSKNAKTKVGKVFQARLDDENASEVSSSRQSPKRFKIFAAFVANLHHMLR